MKRFLLFLGTAGLALWGLAQVHPPVPYRHGSGRGTARIFGLPANPAALYTFGPDPTLVPGARWFWVGRNSLRWSEAFDNSAWLKVRTTVNASGASPRGATAWALAATTDGQSHRVQQSFSGDPGVVYSLSCDVKAADKSVAYLVSEATSPTDSNTTYFDLTNGEVLTSGSNHSNPTISSLGDGWYRISVSFTGSDTECCVHVAFAEADGDPEWTGDGTTIDGYATAMQLEPGTSPTTYQKTGAQQTFHDFSGNDNHAVRGSSENEDTNDPELTPSSRNLLAPGSTEDLTDSNWTATDANTTATTFTPTAQNGQVVQTYAARSQIDYVASASIASGGNTALQWLHIGASGGDTSNVTVTSTPTRYSVTFTGSSAVGAAAFTGSGLDDLTSSGRTPDTFKWSSDGGTTWDATGVEITGSAQTLSNGVAVTFGDSTGHTLGDYWDIPAGSNVQLGLRDPNSSGFGAITFTDVQLETGSTATAYTNPAEESLVQGATFDGVDDGVVQASSFALNDEAFSILALTREDTAPGAGAAYDIVRIDNTAPWRYAVLETRSTKYEVALYNGSSKLRATDTGGPVPLQWQFLSATFGSCTLQLYRNGTLADSTSDPNFSLGTITNQLHIGTLGFVGNYFDGTIALVAVYSRVLSAAETQRSYRSIARLYWDYRSICVSGWESHCQSPPLHAKLLAPWQPDGTWALAMLPRKLGLVPVWR